MQEAGNKGRVAGRVGRWVLVAVWMGVIFGFSAQPQAALNFGQPEFLSKAAHVVEYAILGWLVQRARGDKHAWWQSWLIAVVYAATDEFHQSFTPGRTPRVTDVMIDAVGAAMGMVVAIRRTKTNSDWLANRQ
jgi:VanZ family protein